jgi:hypothetical protein
MSFERDTKTVIVAPVQTNHSLAGNLLASFLSNNGESGWTKTMMLVIILFILISPLTVDFLGFRQCGQDLYFGNYSLKMSHVLLLLQYRLKLDMYITPSPTIGKISQ